ncbi:MAG: hypothetical protein LBT89_06160 [Planctomycetaceae bacterium]|jgi:hypothetical protein|nr:hypothetical protein [Planctomycetaceae bacterium]
MPENKKSLHQRRLAAIIDETLRLIEATGQKIDIEDLVKSSLSDDEQKMQNFFHHGDLDGVISGSGPNGVDIKPDSRRNLAAILAVIGPYSDDEEVSAACRRACLKVYYPEQFAKALENIGLNWENTAIRSWEEGMD